MRPRFCKIIRPGIRGRRECRVLAAPAVSCAKRCKARTRAYRYRRGHPDIPCAMVLRLMARSPRRRIRLVTVADGLKDCLDPVGSTRLRQLDTSNGCQDHTLLPYAASRLRLMASPGAARRRTQVRPAMVPVVCALCSLTEHKPALRPRHAPDTAASTATRPNVRDDGQRPSTGTGWREI
jgi:hypothetical protein